MKFDITNLNVPLLRKMVEWVEEQDQLADPEWSQSEWLQNTACGTAYCLAGKIVLDAGWEPVWVQMSYGEAAWQVTKDGELSTVPRAALNELGVSVSENLAPGSFPLFAATNDVTDIRLIGEFLAGERL